jgi:hypothetical protein
MAGAPLWVANLIRGIVGLIISTIIAAMTFMVIMVVCSGIVGTDRVSENLSVTTLTTPATSAV